MSVLGRQWLEADPAARLVVLDTAPLDAAALRYFAPVMDRLTMVVADVTRPETWRDALASHEITYVVHGATVTPLSGGTVTEAQREPEADSPARIIEVNVMGTVAMLEWARVQPSLRRFIYVSSGAVYKNHGPDRPGEPLPEDGYVLPRRLYGVSKFASELISERYAELFGLSIASVRLSSVYGPMDRVTASRNFRHVPNQIAHLAIAGATRVRVNSLEGVGDYISSEDVASAMIALLKAPSLRFATYNIAAGVTATLGNLADWAAEKAPGFSVEVGPADQVEIYQDDTLRDGMWGAYDISRMTVDTGWKPRPVREALHAYMDWIAAQET